MESCFRQVKKDQMINIGGKFAALAVSTVVFTALGNAQSLILISHTGNQYQYGLQVDVSHGFGFVPGGQVSLTGLAGVTNASVLLETRLFTTTAPVITATSVSFNVTNSPVFDPAPFSFSVPLVSVTSPALPAGGIRYRPRAELFPEACQCRTRSAWQSGGRGTVPGM
jgi:hypothetical protein